jgi:uncharacterized protein YbjT (DUF2867 family)
MILVTGGTGFIGRNLLRSLVKTGKKVRVLLRPSRYSPNFPLGIPVEVAVSSFSDSRSLRAALKGVDVIFHLAGAERKGLKGDLNQIDVEGTANLVQAAKEGGLERFFYLSHIGADRGSAYPVLKAKGIGENWIINSGLPYTIFRTGVVFGKGDQFTEPILRLIKLFPGFFLLPGNGDSLLQPLWVDDLVTCMNLALEDSKKVKMIFTIGGLESFTYRQIIETIMEKTRRHRLLIQTSPTLLRTISLWADQFMPNFPISIFWLDQLAEDRTANLNTIPVEFGLMPARFKNQIDYLNEKYRK